MKSFVAFLIASGLAAASIPAWAQGAYAGVGVGQSTVDLGPCDLDISCSSDDSDTAYKIFAGYKFTPNWAIEGAYVNAGEFTQNGTDSSLGTASVTFEVSGFNLAGLGIYPVSERFSVQGKVGVFIWDMDIDASSSVLGSGSLSESGNSPMFGVGGTFHFNQKIGVLVEFERYIDVGEEDITGEADADVWSASLVYSF